MKSCSRIVAVFVSCISAVLLLGSNLAFADESVSYQEAAEFWKEETSITQSRSLMDAAGVSVAPTDAVAATNPVCVLTLQYDDTGRIANSVEDLRDCSWASSIRVNDRLVGVVFLWRNGDVIEAGGFSPNVEEASMLLSQGNSTIVADEYRQAFYRAENGMISALNEKAREYVPTVQSLSRADRQIKVASSSDIVGSSSSIGTNDEVPETPSIGNVNIALLVFAVASVSLAVALMAVMMKTREKAGRHATE